MSSEHLIGELYTESVQDSKSIFIALTMLNVLEDPGAGLTYYIYKQLVELIAS